MNANIIVQAVTLINALIDLLNVSKEYRATIALAIAEGRQITESELDTAAKDAQSAIDEALED